MSKLTEVQQKFLKQLFGPSMGNAKDASKTVIGTEDYSSLMTDELTIAIRKRADSELALNVPKAVFIISKIMDDPESHPFMDKLHRVAADVLDRAGLSKQERVGNNMITVGVVMMPSKSIMPEPPTLENTPTNLLPQLRTEPLNAIQAPRT